MAALKLLKDGRMVAFRVEVTADTMIEVELAEQREQTSEFMGAMTQFIQASAQLPPNTLPITSAMIQWAVRQFRVGRDIEGKISAGIDKMLSDAAAQEGQPPPEDPKVTVAKMKQESDAQAAQQDSQAKMAEMQAKAQAAQEESDRKMQEMQATMQMNAEKMQAELQADRERTSAELQAMREKNAAEIEAILVKANIQAETAQTKAVVDGQAKAAEAQQSLSFEAAAHEQSMEHNAEAGEQDLKLQKAQAAIKPKGGSDAE